MLRFSQHRILLLLVLTIWSQPARADIWDWFAELSGPGGFHSRGNLTFTVYCWHGDLPENAAEGTTGPARNDKWFHLLQSPNRDVRGPCVFFDFRAFENKDLHDPNATYLPTRLEIYTS